ncbi:translation initiation factor IF-2-like isoform X2 [Oenanthe melanoleuca]|uniref:translation initiation factor IF-2-like isoform X2 n=1 Tax=Oenanthe melanoleuca TaxID=2939378 RepID=UPI0024C162F0|nr:translation initiation factor IF-2-like isoform X2 [Oenanthe melanoleuca]
MCGPAGPASPPHQHGPASACRRPGRAAEGKFASATPHPSRSRRRSRRPGRAVAVRRTRSRPTRHPPAPPVSPPVVPQVPPRPANLQAGPARRSRCDTRSHGGTRASPPRDRAPQPAAARPSRGGPGRAVWAARDRGNAGLGGQRDTAIVSVFFRCFSFSFVSFRFVSFLPPVTGGQRLRGVAWPPCRRVTHRMSLSSPFALRVPRPQGFAGHRPSSAGLDRRREEATGTGRVRRAACPL